jgi:predicted DNA repair protein MutK
MMKGLSIIGTAAMFMVGGGILIHGIPGAEEFIHDLAQSTSAIPVIGGLMEAAGSTLLGALAGIIAGALVFVGVTIASRVFRTIKAKRA